MSVDAAQRFTRRRPCPICAGGDDMPRGKGKRCCGYRSSDGRFAYCSRAELAGGLEAQVGTEPVTFRHFLEGDCHCGTSHGPGRDARTETSFVYVDEEGAPLFRTVRLDGPEGKRIWQERFEGGHYVKGLGAARRVLYRLPEIVAAETVHVVEGERCADALAELGFAATTNPMGAGKWRDEYADVLADAFQIYVWPDADAQGRTHADTIARSLTGRVPRLRVVDLEPEREDGYDVADLLREWSRNGSRDDLRGYVESMVGLALELGEWQPRPERDAVGTRFEYSPPEKGKTAIASPRPDVEGTRGGTQSFSGGSVRGDELVFVDVATFAERDEPGASALLGDEENVVIPEGGDVMVYGDGGAGKTTLAIDASVHLAAGDNWIEVPVARPVRVGLIENEGPRPLFRAKLRRKLAAWKGSRIESGYLLQLEEPWGKVSIESEAMREALGSRIAALELDIVVIGPITRSGMNEAGTLQQVRDYLKLFADVRARSGRRVTFVLIHHENRGGQVSGAWEGAVDTLFHVQAVGNGQTRLFIQKARWAPDYHKQKLQLAWAEGEGYELLEDEERDDNAVADEILTYVLAHGGTGWNPVDKAVAGKGDRLRLIRDRLLSSGQLVNRGSATHMQLWHAEDPALPPEEGVQATFEDEPA